MLFPYVVRRLPDLAYDLVMQLLKSGDEKIALIVAWLIFYASLLDERFVAASKPLEHGSAEHRRLLASIFSENVTNAENRVRTTAVLQTLFFDEDPKVRELAATAFYKMKPEEVESFIDFTFCFLRSPAFCDSSHPLLNMLESATCDTQALVLEVAHQVIKDAKNNQDSTTVRYRDVRDLADLLKREYATTESNPEARARILDLIDGMIAHDLYGVDEIVNAHDRW